MLGQKKSSCLGAVAGKVGFPSDVKKEQVTNMCVEELRMPTEPKQPISLDACQQKREERKVLPTPLPPFATQPQALVSKEVSGQCFATTIKESNQELQTKQNVNEMAKPILVKIPRNLITRLPQNHPQQLSKHSPIWVNISKDLISHLPEPKAQVTENQTSLKSFHDKMNGSCKRTHSLEEGEIYREGSAKKFRPDPSHKQDPLYKNENTPPEELTLDSRMRCH
ncbi:uncharacterized protein LOC129232601 [Uloborus diversus]|uniref:uncharacterized protein LOC129232601 n=1 Tax=Uloborus diversus TaxID=327109 RepID=UPI00240A0FED|nr:uncharacterized protein LOC129232601 [Uloborus diversus]